jgi:SAM-dependent methyltransferase
LSDRDPAILFSDRAADYVRYRPGYPAAAADAILNGLGDPSRLTAADVGAGTGISSRLLASRGVRVLAVEPNAAMRAAAEPHPRVQWLDGRAEATGLAAASVGLVLVAQAFHWVRVAEAVAEFHRVLAPGGRLAIMWNTRDRSDPLTAEYCQAILEARGEGPRELAARDLEVVTAEGVTADGRFGVPRIGNFENEQRLDLAGLVGRATSASYVPKHGPEFERLRGRLAEAFERHRDAAGFVRMKYVTRLFTTHRPGRPA